MPSHPAIIRATVSNDGVLLSADASLLALQHEAGGAVGQALAVPQLAAVARLAARLGLMVSRPVVAAAERGDIDMWVRAKPEGACIALSIIDWQERPAVVAQGDVAGRDADIAALGDGWIWQIDTQLQFQMVMEGPSPRGVLPEPAPLPGARFSSYFQLQPDADGDMAMLRALAQRRAFRDQTVRMSADPAKQFQLAGFPSFDLTGQWTGYRGTACSLDTCEDVPPDKEVQPSFYPVEFGQRLDRSLRQPLSRIIANADSISAQLEGPLRPDYAGYASDIAAAGRHLMALVDDLADLQAIDRPDFTVLTEDVDVADIGRRAAGLLAVRALDRQINIVAPDAGESAPAIGEFRRVLQILVNLVGNAVRYSPDGSTIWIETEADADRVRIIITDQGVGVAPENRERIFDKFERLGRDDAGGSGLGLYISRRLARAMNGDIEIGSGPDSGARFILTLPAPR